MPSLVELERFSEANLKAWMQAGTKLQALYAAFYFELEPKRQKDGQRLLDALRSRATQDFLFENWSRVVDYRYSDDPLSMAGSIRGIGGRFNLGEEISPGTITSFPALYLAEDAETAYRERFGAPTNPTSGLAGTELALRSNTSFAQVQIRGQLDFILDVGDLGALQPFVDVIRGYEVPKTVRLAARSLAMRRPPWMIRSATMLQRQLLHVDWRAWPMQFSVPSNSQVFGRLASAAGLHGVLYPSTKNAGKRCLVLFPKNWIGSGSFIELADLAPASVSRTRVDGGKISAH